MQTLITKSVTSRNQLAQTQITKTKIKRRKGKKLITSANNINIMNTNLAAFLKIPVLDQYVLHVLTHDSETWLLTKDWYGKLKSAERVAKR